MKVVVVAGMSDEKLISKILPIASLEEVSNIYLVRRRPIKMEKVKNLVLPSFLSQIIVLAEIYRFLSLLYICLIQKPDAVIAFYFFPHGLYAGIVGLITRLRVIQCLIGTDLPRVTSSKLLLKLLVKAKYIAVRGQKSRDLLISNGVHSNQVFIPPNYVDLDFFASRSKETIIRHPPKKYDLIYVGNLVKSKNLTQLLHVIVEVRKELPNTRVAIIGDGPERSNLFHMADQLQIQKNVEFLGLISQKTVVNYLFQSRVFIMTTLWEGLPMAMVEAMSCGLPVVVPDVGDIPDLAQDKVNAIIVSPPITDNFVKAVISILSDDNLYNHLARGAKEYREKFFQEFSLENIKQIWREVLLS